MTLISWRHRTDLLFIAKTLSIRQRLAVTRQYRIDHGLLREMQKDSFAKRFGARLRGGGILKRDLDRVGHGGDDVGRKQRLGMQTKNFRYTANVRGYHGHSRSGRLDHDIGHGILAGWYYQQAALRGGVSR